MMYQYRFVLVRKGKELALEIRQFTGRITHASVARVYLRTSTGEEIRAKSLSELKAMGWQHDPHSAREEAEAHLKLVLESGAAALSEFITTTVTREATWESNTISPAGELSKGAE